METKLTIIIVNYNTKELVLDCLTSIKNSQNIDFGVKVVVVDNDSSDGSEKELEKVNWISTIFLEENIGFARANNKAIKAAEGKYVWFLNPDTVVEPDTIAFMVKYMDDHPDVGVATPKLTLPNGKLDKNCHRAFPTPGNSISHFLGLDKLFPRSYLFSNYYLGFIPENQESEVDVVGGSSVLIRKEVGEKIHWWDESYFMYGEDIALTFEVKKLGFKVMYAPQVIIHHYHGASSGLKKTSKSVSKADKKTRLKTSKATVDAMKIFYRKYYRDKYPKYLTTAVLFAISLLGLLRQVKIRIGL